MLQLCLAESMDQAMPQQDRIRSLRRDIIDLKLQLHPLESGQLYAAQRPHGGMRSDKTRSYIRDLKKMIGPLKQS
jgi:hypothetical protein